MKPTLLFIAALAFAGCAKDRQPLTPEKPGKFGRFERELHYDPELEVLIIRDNYTPPAPEPEVDGAGGLPDPAHGAE